MTFSTSRPPRRLAELARHASVIALLCCALMPAPAAAMGPEGAENPFAQSLAVAAAGDETLAGFYAAHGYGTLWTGKGDAARRAALFDALDHVADHGLPVGRYHADLLRERFRHVASESQRARLEVAATRAFLTYATDVNSGFLNPQKVDSGIVREMQKRDPAAILADFAAAADPGAFLGSLPPQAPAYAELQRARLALLEAQSGPGWGATVPASKLAPGDEGPAVVALRDRMRAQGFLPRSVSARYDDAMVTAVKRFQSANGLKPTGIASAETLAEINRAPGERLAAVTVALERMRWLNGTELGSRHIWVNLPDFTAKLVQDGRVTFSTDTVVGMNAGDRRSPEFSDFMEFMVVNPRWSVPRSITVKEYLPMLQKNRMAVRHLRIVDRSGRDVDRSRVDFTQYNARNFPYSMTQDPSEANALGLVKFMFPNPWNIYLHDTPQKPLFKKETRAFSHGCIRLAQPFDFAYALLSMQSADPRGLFQSHLSSGRESVLKLTAPVPVHLVYFTAWPDADGRIEYRRDVYGRDATIFHAMQEAGVDEGVVQG